ncbi:MAG TPA: pentapeptide repeat-containing protein [Byssovorax sp.]|jgi:uncharacterized protein YjbI with pentapeptide repeats
MPGPVAVLPLCPVACGSVVARVGEELRAVVIVKASFTLAHERSAWPIVASPLVEVDEHVGGHPSASLVAASERAPILPGAGVLLTGAAYAPHGRPVTECAVRLAVFQDGAAVVNKHLVVRGDATRDAPQPAPFTRMPLVYERAYGGPSVAENPAGVGAGSARLPNVLDPRDPDRTAGFGPIAPTWAPRAAPMRSFDAAPREGDAIVLAADAPFDALHAAPGDQRLEAIRGDEWIVLDGLHAVHARVQTQLPFARAVARFVRVDRPGPLEEVPLRADTLTIDAEALVASIVWRGHVVVESLDAVAALRVYAALELPSLPVRWPAAPTPDAHDTDPLEPSWPDIPDTTTERDVRAIRAALARPPGSALVRTATFTGAVLPALPFDAASSSSISAPPVAATVHEATDTIDGGSAGVAVLPFLGRGSPPAPPILPASVEAVAAAVAGLREEIAARIASRASLADLPLAGAQIADVKLAGADLRGADLTGADLTRADLTRADLGGARLDGAILVEANLAYARCVGASFAGVRGAGATFTRAALDDASFADAELDGADFTGASLGGAKLTHARLRDARLVDARAPKASFEGALLDGANASGASLVGALLGLAQAKGCALAGVDLTGASAEGALLEGANLSRAVANGARLAGARLRGANLSRVAASAAELVGADLSGADLRQAKLDEAVLDDAKLRDAQASLVDLSRARLRDADCTGANLREANLAAADLTGARLDRADLRDADLTGATLVGASQQGAKLAGAKRGGAT